MENMLWLLENELLCVCTLLVANRALAATVCDNKHPSTSVVLY